MKIYFLSGLGADRRAFLRLRFGQNTEVQYLDWLAPFPNEPLVEYAKRMTWEMDLSKPYILTGYSFGGILATEMLRFIQPLKTILISSISRRHELPWYFRLAGRLNLHKLLPPEASNRANFLTYWTFGIQTPEDRALLNEILATTDVQFSKWAIDQILKWDRIHSPDSIIRIHGDQDRMLPLIKFIPQYKIKNAGHFMVANRAEEVSNFIQREVDSLEIPGKA
jgi:hypothetical protein